MSTPQPEKVPNENAGRIKDIDVNAMVSSTGQDRVVNNVMRHEYRVLEQWEKVAMQKIKDDGLAFFEYLEYLGQQKNSRQLSIAKTKIEEAVMWAVKHITE